MTVFLPNLAVSDFTTCSKDEIILPKKVMIKVLQNIFNVGYSVSYTDIKTCFYETELKTSSKTRLYLHVLIDINF